MTWFDKLKKLMAFYDLFTPTEKLQSDIVKIIQEVEATHQDKVFKNLMYHPFQYPGHESVFASWAYYTFEDCKTLEDFQTRLKEVETNYIISMPVIGLTHPRQSTINYNEDDI